MFTYRAPESEIDNRYTYDTEVLRLALEKTRSMYGAYRMVPSPALSFARAMLSVSRNTYPNFFIKLSYEDSLVSSQNMSFARFPVDLGIVGYRVCFVSPDAKARLATVKTADQLRTFTMGQGSKWADVEILRYNGFSVVETPLYESLFKMVASNRFDLFCRGTNELLDEYEAHKHIAGLSYDETLSIAYPLPRFFYTHQTNAKARDRIEAGLILAYQDGSLQRLWQKNYQRSIDFVQLGRRKIFWFENPLLKQLDFDYRKYFYDPLKETRRNPGGH